jgi:hypothetical protein
MALWFQWEATFPSTARRDDFVDLEMCQHSLSEVRIRVEFAYVYS